MRRFRRILLAFLTVAFTAVAMPLPVLAAKVPVPQNVRWEGSKACWDEAEDAYQYQIQMYKNGTKLKSTISTTATSIDLNGYMREKGNYAFRVRVRDRISDEYGSYSNSSSTYVQEKNQITRNRDSKGRYVPESKPDNPGPGVAGKGWKSEGNRWWYRHDDGTYPTNQWYQVGECWYYFDGEGYMQTGWLTIDSNQYYCQEDGSRAVGWIDLDGSYFYFNEQGIYEK